MLSQVMNNAQIRLRDSLALGISFCGPVNSLTGRVITAHVLTKDWEGLNIVYIFQERLGIPTYVENDANAAALTEGLFGINESAFQGRDKT
jgi:predicted NBD/HSP70 family sugar kinase